MRLNIFEIGTSEIRRLPAAEFVREFAVPEEEWREVSAGLAAPGEPQAYGFKRGERAFLIWRTPSITYSYYDRNTGEKEVDTVDEDDRYAENLLAAGFKPSREPEIVEKIVRPLLRLRATSADYRERARRAHERSMA